MSLLEVLCILYCLLLMFQFVDLEIGKYLVQWWFIFEELLVYNFSMLVFCVGVQCYYVQLLSINNILKDKLLVLLLFKFISVQVWVVVEIECDMVLDVLMMCLVQGDVGLGKMLVVVLVVLCVIVYGKQVVLMVLIELLVEQYVNNFCNWFELLGVEVGWLVGK